MDKGKTVGFLSCKLEAGVGYIGNLLVAKTDRRRGVGKTLLTTFEAFAKEKGIHKIFFYTGKTWEARVFYESFGYTVLAELPNHYLHHDFVLMNKFI